MAPTQLYFLLYTIVCLSFLKPYYDGTKRACIWCPICDTLSERLKYKMLLHVLRATDATLVVLEILPNDFLIYIMQ